MTQSEYNAEIESIAREAREQEAEGYDLQDAIHELVDGHQWVIYNANHLDVLRYSDNEEAGIEEGLIDANAALKEGGLYRLTAQLAFCAMATDVNEALADLVTACVL
jgi:hypothetical protein